MEQLVGVFWNEGSSPLFLVFPPPPLVMCMDGTFYKYTFVVEGNFQRVFWPKIVWNIVHKIKVYYSIIYLFNFI